MTVTRSRVIVGVDDSAAGLAALRWAVSQARSQHADLTCPVVTVPVTEARPPRVAGDGLAALQPAGGG